MRKVLFISFVLLYLFSLPPLFPAHAATFSLNKNPATTADIIEMYATGCDAQYVKKPGGLGALFQWKKKYFTSYESGRAFFDSNGNATLQHQFTSDGDYEIRMDCDDKAGQDLTKAVALDFVGQLHVDKAQKEIGDCNKDVYDSANPRYVFGPINPPPTCGANECQAEKDILSTQIKIICWPQKAASAPPTATPIPTSAPPAVPPATTAATRTGSWRDCYIHTDTTAGAGFEVASLPCLSYYMGQVITYAFVFAGTVAVIMILWAGFRYVTSGGDPKQAGAARQILTFAIIGLIIILLSGSIIGIISYITGFDIIGSFNAVSP